jgi:uncharacterized protein (TIGR02145 family)
MKNNNLIFKFFLLSAILFSSSGYAQTVTIGNQVWTSKNLNVATYRNGDVIPQVRDKAAWSKLTTGAWCYYKNDASNGTKYGKLYNWYAVNDPRGLAPNGYHIPTDAEWTRLNDYLGERSEAGKKMKSTSGWYDNGNGTNSSGFSGLPCGYRFKDGNFQGVGDVIYLWSSSEDGTDGYNGAWCLRLFYADDSAEQIAPHKRLGFPVRCLRD